MARLPIIVRWPPLSWAAGRVVNLSFSWVGRGGICLTLSPFWFYITEECVEVFGSGELAAVRKRTFHVVSCVEGRDNYRVSRNESLLEGRIGVDVDVGGRQ